MRTHDEDLRHWLENYFEEIEGMTMNMLSRRIGVSKLALQAYLDGMYFAPKEVGGLGVTKENSTVESRIRAYRDRVFGGYGVLEDSLIF